MSHRLFGRLASSVLLVVGLFYGQIVAAALLGISPASHTTVPYVSGGNQGTLSFTSGNLVLNGFASRWTEVPLSTANYGTNAGYLFAVGSTTSAATLKLNFNISPAGVPSGAPGHDLVLTGDAYAGAPSYALQHSGTLLTGEIVSFGSSVNAGFGVFDMRFRVTGGALAPLFAGKDIGLRLDLEATTFTGSFATNFTAGRAKPALGAIGQLCVALQKEISVDGGATWADADTAGAADTPSVSVPNDAEYRFAVRNCGTGNLANVVVSDATLGVTHAIGTLAAGETTTVGKAQVAALYVPGRCDAAGTQINSARVDAKAASTTEVVSDVDDAVVVCTTTPQIDLIKEVSVDGGATWHDANTNGTAPVVTAPHGAEYRFTVTNTGSANLTGVVLNDATLGITGHLVGDLATGASAVIGSGQIPAASVAERCAGPGDYTNVADVAGQSVDDGATVTAADPAVLVCAGQPGLKVRKEISVDGGATWADANNVGDADTPIVTYPHGADYRFIITNIGDVALENVVVDDAALGINYAVPGMLAAGTTLTLDSGSLAGLSVSTRCDASGSVTNVVSVTGASAMTGETSAASDTAVMVCIGEPAIRLLKQISLDGVTWADADTAATALEAIYPSDAAYRFVVSNIGTVDLVNVAVSDPSLGVVASVGNLAVGQAVTIDSATVAALHVVDRCVAEGVITNVAQADGEAADTGEPVSDSDPAVMSCVAPPPAALGDFVWLDSDKNGIQDAGEGGVQDVRVDLLDLAGNVLATQLTDVNGNYLFEDLEPGSYRVRFYPPTGLVVTSRDVGDDAKDSDADLISGETGVYTLAAGDTNLTVDAGLYPEMVTDCGCEGKVTELTMRYTGSTSANVVVKQKKDGAVVFDGPVSPNGVFSFAGTDKKGTLTTEIYIFVDGVLNAQIHTSCSQPVGPGLVAGDFEVVAGASRGFPNLCPVDAPPPSDPPPSDPPTSGSGSMGCTPGYWRQKHHFGNWVGYTPEQAFAAVFEDAFPSLSLGQVVRMKGGDLNALGRHTVAALLNAANSEVDYGMAPQDVVDAFNAVYPGGDYESLKNKFANMNERGCPLARASR